MRTAVLRRAQTHAGPLVLINQTHPLRQTEAVALAAPDGRRPNVLLERQAALLLYACIRQVGGEEEIVPVSGWRSRQEQEQIWQDTLEKEGEAFTRRYVARPGCSEHESGLAMDLGLAAAKIDFIRPHFPDTGVCAAFRRAAARYGFIQRYRKEKEELTGIAEEPWHFRYVGVPHALLMEEHGLCLEEYAAFLRRESRLCPLGGGRRARVSYLALEGEEQQVPLPDGCCQISGDNQGGFVLTEWEWAP